jgi:F-type H+-transporting ATPase subunit gamma
MAKTREIKGRIKAVSNIQRITKTMQMIATARFQAAQRRALAAQPYSRKIAEMVSELATALAASGSSIDHPLLRPATGKGRRLILIVTSNRGLCGGYNANVLRTGYGFVKASSGRPLDVEVVGRKGLAYLKFAKVDIKEFHAQFTDKPDYATTDALAQKYMDAFAAGTYDSVHVSYMSYISTSRQTPVTIQLLPLQSPASAAASKTVSQYEFSPTPKELLAELLPVTVKTQLFQAFNEANVSEHIARMVAMKAATDNAGKMRKSLSRRFNRARQAAITTELSEIVAGAAALK